MLIAFVVAARNLSLSSSWPVRRGDCEAIVNTSHYNIREFKKRDVDIIDDVATGNRYVVRLCHQEWTSSSNDAYADAFLLRCEPGTFERCAPAVTLNSLDYRPLNVHNFSEGLIYFGNGEPFYDSDGRVRTLDLEWRIYCDPDQPEANVSANFTVIDSDENITGLVIGTMRSKWGCPTTQPTPIPTPMYEPHCEYIDRYDQEPAKGVDFNLVDLNDGPFGVKSTLTVNGTTKVLYFQSCERMYCPPTYDCPEGLEYHSSAWLCDDPSTSTNPQCLSYGVGVDEPILEPLEGNVSKGMMLKMENPDSDRSVSLLLTCKSDFPDGHIDWIGNKTELTGGHLTVTGMTSAVCLKPLPSPTPAPSDMCFFSGAVQGKTVSIDLKSYNKGESEGWNSHVKVDGMSGFPESTLMYQPCGSMVCPPDTYCSGDEDATVWLCFTEGTEKICQGYGLWENNVSMDLWDRSTVDSGVRATYKGDMRRVVEVQYVCNEQLGENEIVMPSSVSIEQKKMTFVVQSVAACPSWHPSKPEKKETPTPNPSPRPDFVVFNETHFVKLDLDDLVQEKYDGILKVSSSAQKGTIKSHVAWHPWSLVSPPSGETSPFDGANLWTCWGESEGTYCHPVGDKRLGVSIDLADRNDYSRGVNIHYGGAYDLNSEIHVMCDTSKALHSIMFDEETKLTYYEGSKFTADVTSGAACPHEFTVPVIPTPVEQPEEKEDSEYSYELTIDGTTRSVDFYDVGSLSQDVIVGYETTFERNRIYMDIASKVPCPDGHSCFPSDEASVWRCFNTSTQKNVCISLADSDFGITYSGISTNNAAGFIGIKAAMRGGYAENLVLDCICSSNEGYHINTVLEKSIDGSTIMMTLESQEFCHEAMTRAKTTVGSIIFFLILLAIVVYFGLGTLVNYLLHRVPEIPNASLWHRLGQYLAQVKNLCSKKGTEEASLSYSRM